MSRHYLLTWQRWEQRADRRGLYRTAVTARDSCVSGPLTGPLPPSPPNDTPANTEEQRSDTYKTRPKDLSQCHSVHHNSHKDWPGREPGPLRWNRMVYSDKARHKDLHRFYFQSTGAATVVTVKFFGTWKRNWSVPVPVPAKFRHFRLPKDADVRLPKFN